MKKNGKLFNKKIFHGILILGIFVFIIIILNKIVREGFYQTGPVVPKAGGGPVGVKPFVGTIPSGPPSTGGQVFSAPIVASGGIPKFVGTIPSGPPSTGGQVFSAPIVASGGVPTFVGTIPR